MSVSISRDNQHAEYRTPDDFLGAVRARFGALAFDLAASKRSAITPKFYSMTQDSLRQHWPDLKGKLWLNPPYGNIAPWAGKAAISAQQGAEILMLVPASVGANWYRDFGRVAADTYALCGRLTFKGETTPYPKDCMLLHFHQDVAMGNRPAKFFVWSWREGKVA